MSFSATNSYGLPYGLLSKKLLDNGLAVFFAKPAHGVRFGEHSVLYQLVKNKSMNEINCLGVNLYV